MRVFAVLLCLLLAGCATAATPPAVTARVLPAVKHGHAAPPRPCGSTLDQMLLSLQKNAKYAYVADAIDSRARVHMWYINGISGIWAQLRVYDDLHACVEGAGPSWRWTRVPRHLPAAEKETPSTPAGQLQKQPLCDRNLDHMLHGLGLGARDSYVADVIDSKGHFHKWFVDEGNRFWADIRVYRDRHACIRADGGDWHWAVAQ